MIKKMGIIDPLVKPRLIVLSDIGNEPDDQQSLVRLLTYANEFDIEGLIATTSVFQKGVIRPDLMEKVIKAYDGNPRENLMIHSKKYFPTGEELITLIKKGPQLYGMEAIGSGRYSQGSEWIIYVLDKRDPRPLWISIWGGPNCLAQALWKLKNSRSPSEFNRIIKRLRVYAISDQDDSGKWIRDNFPNLFYIVSPSDPSTPEKMFRDITKATWNGISGEILYKFKGGPNSKLITNRWVRKNVRQNHGPLGEVYPRIAFAMEGDTPSYLNLISNGLRSSQHPSFGGWGGRYELSQPKEEIRPIYTDCDDSVVVGEGLGEIKGDVNGTYTSNKATIWRWREAFQNDFAARMDWASTPNYEQANHPPVVKVKGKKDLSVNANETFQLDASISYDPDGNKLSYHWFHYKEVGNYTGEIVIHTPNFERTQISFNNPSLSGVVHIILEVKDDGKPCLYRYARFIIDVKGID